MRKASTLSALVMLISHSASAACFGSGSMQTCTDNSGNNYSVNRMGNTTVTNGYNAQTGSQWSDTTNTMGNMVMHNGNTNGQPWNMTQQNLGNVTTYNGMNAAGNSFSHTCVRLANGMMSCN